MNRHSTQIAFGASSQANQTYKNSTSNSRSIIRSNAPSSSHSLNLSLDSPYKNSMSELKLMNMEDDDEDSNHFKTPVPIRKVPKVFPKKLKQTKLSSKKKCFKSTNSIQKVTTDNFGNLDVNPEHLQMAMALSKSAFELENPQINHAEIDLLAVSNPIKSRTLGRFGFKSEVHTEFNPAERLEVKKRKNSKFRFITPILYSRTDEERESQITTKVSSILCQKGSLKSQEISQEKREIYSDYLKNYIPTENRILKSNSFCYGNLKGCKFCTDNLNISPTKSSYGSLLKKWEDIPGRNKSPLRTFTLIHTIRSEEKSNHSIDNLTEGKFVEESSETFTKQQSCSSPDLFDSDDEGYSPKMRMTPKKLEVTKIFKSDSGIEHFETFSSDSLVLTEDICDIPFSAESGRSNNTNNESAGKREINDSLGVLDDKIEIPNKYTIPNLGDDIITTGFQNISAKNEINLRLDTLDITKDYNLNPNRIEYSSSLPKPSLSLEKSSLNCTKNLNITDYITNMLQQCNCLHDVDNIDDTQFLEKKVQLNKNSSSQESIVISDEELDYSNVHNKEIKSKNVYDVKDCDEEFVENLQEESLNDIHLNLKYKYAKKRQLADQRIEMNTQQTKDSGKKITVTPIKYKSEKRRKGNERFEKLLVEDENRTAQELNKYQTKENSILLSQSSNSQESIIISDDELNYSSFQSKEIKCKSFYGLQDYEKETSPFINEENLEDIHLALKTKYNQQTQLTREEIEIVEVSKEENCDGIINPITDVPQEVLTLNDSLNDLVKRESIIKSLEEQQETATSSLEFSQSDIRKTSEIDLQISNNVETPEKGVIIKTTNVTPMPKYNEMDTPKIRAELDKIGVKPLKRRRGIQLLEHIYNCTHPELNPQEIESIKNADSEGNEVIKKRKVLFEAPDKNKKIIANVECDFHVHFQQERENINVIGDLLLKNEKFEDLIFEKKYSKKVQSCPVPLQIAWYNFLMANPKLHENILSYEPLHLEVIHCMLKEQSGCKFNIQDLITFLDKKCIIFRVQQSAHQMRSKRMKLE